MSGSSVRCARCRYMSLEGKWVGVCEWLSERGREEERESRLKSQCVGEGGMKVDERRRKK